MSAVLFAGSIVAPSFCRKSFVFSAKVIGLGASGFGFGAAVCAGSGCCAKAAAASNIASTGTATMNFLISILSSCSRFLRRLFVRLLVAHKAVERGHVLVGDAQQLDDGGAERIETEAVFGRERKARADVALIINEEGREGAVIGFEQPLEQLLTVGGARHVEIAPLEFRVGRQHQR